MKKFTAFMNNFFDVDVNTPIATLIAILYLVIGIASVVILMSIPEVF